MFTIQTTLNMIMIDLGVEKQEKKKWVGGKKDDSVSTSCATRPQSWSCVKQYNLYDCTDRLYIPMLACGQVMLKTHVFCKSRCILPRSTPWPFKTIMRLPMICSASIFQPCSSTVTSKICLYIYITPSLIKPEIMSNTKKCGIFSPVFAFALIFAMFSVFL